MHTYKATQAHTAKSAALPNTASDELKWPSADLCGVNLNGKVSNRKI